MPSVLRLLPLALLLATGCMKPYIKAADGFPPSGGVSALLVSQMIVNQESSSEGAAAMEIARASTAMAHNKELPVFNDRLSAGVATHLGEHGVTVVRDAARTEALTRVDWGDMTNAMSVLSGSYVDPAGSTLVVVPTVLNRKRLMEKTAEALGGGESYVYVYTQVIERHRFVIMREPQVVVHVTVTDPRGVEVYRARGVGEGDMSAFVMNKSADALTGALDEALAELKSVPVAPLE